MSICILESNFWMGGNDITVEGEWVWPEDTWIFYSNSNPGYYTDWDSGNVFLSYKINMLIIQYPICIYMSIIGLIS